MIVDSEFEQRRCALDNEMLAGVISVDAWKIRMAEVDRDENESFRDRNSLIVPPGIPSAPVRVGKAVRWDSDLFLRFATAGNAIAVNRTAQRLLIGTLRLLPAQHRVRYAEELYCELRDIPGRRRQLAYSLRLIFRSWSLRRSLKAACRTSDA